MSQLMAKRPFRRLQAALQTPTHKMFEALASLLTRAGRKNSLEGQKFLYSPGTVPLCFVAHIDTVHYGVPTVVIQGPSRWEKNTVKVIGLDGKGRQTGLGADDRAGIWLCQELLLKGSRAHFLFTDEEESGCGGAREAALALEKHEAFQKSVHCFVQLDRRGHNDAVYYDCPSKKMRQWVEEFKWVEEDGSLSDISVLGPELDVAAVNLSVGYYSAHMDSESITVGELVATLERISRMQEKPPRERIPYETEEEAEERKRKRSSYGSYGVSHSAYDYLYWHNRSRRHGNGRHVDSRYSLLCPRCNMGYSSHFYLCDECGLCYGNDCCQCYKPKPKEAKAAPVADCTGGKSAWKQCKTCCIRYFMEESMCQECDNCYVRGCCQCHMGEKKVALADAECATCRATWMDGGHLCKQCHSCKEYCCACKHQAVATGTSGMNLEMLLLPPEGTAESTLEWNDTDFFPDDLIEKGGSS